LLHGCCHNPTGIDFTHSEWDLILDCCLKKGLLPLFDIAYLGLGDGIDEDRYAVNTFFKSGIEMCVAFSYSKTMDLYRERVGALMIVNRSHTHEGMQSTIKQIIRRNYSSPPAHGALVVKTVLTDLKRKKLWLDELEEHRLRSCAMRELILKEFGGWIQHKKEFQEAKGFFSYLGISKDAVLELRKESIYLLDDSRLNVLGVNSANIGRLKQVFSRLRHG
jgi:aspartate/tyrosine/aromatic aminotransferase